MSGQIIGIVGLGEAGSAIAGGLVGAGARVVGYDAGDEGVRERAEAVGVDVLDSLEGVTARSTVIICLTTASSAVRVAEEAAQSLGSRHIYSDWNSAGPSVKRQVEHVISSSGASFVDGAVMAAVPARGHRVPVLLSGSASGELSARLRSFGMQTEPIGGEAGHASSVKMFRSAIVKGIEALLLESLVAADSVGVNEQVLRSIDGSLPFDDWQRLANYMLPRTVSHVRRRAHELREVADTLDHAGVVPLMASAAAARLEWLRDLNISLDEVSKMTGYEGVLAAIRKAQRLNEAD